MSKLTISQNKVIDNLLVLGGSRPFSSTNDAVHLKEYIEKKIGNELFDWKGGKIFVTKSLLRINNGCQVSYLADLERKSDKFSIATVVGSIVHKAIQISYTHPSKSQQETVLNALKALRISNQKFDEWYATQEVGVQSEIIALSSSKYFSFLDDWPRLDPSWTPRFEEPINVKFKDFTLSSRPDLILGRPHTDFKRTMLVVDFKTSQLRDEHRDESLFYALVMTLRYGVMPWRSSVYSLSGGDWTEPDFSLEDLEMIADKTVQAVKLHASLTSGLKEPVFVPGDQCSWCVLRESCPQKIS